MDDWEGSDDVRRGVLGPVLITVVIMLLLALIGFGVWLALRDRDGGSTPAPTPAPTAGTSAPTAPSTTPPTTTAPAPTTTEPAMVALPELGGKDYDTAAAELAALGLVPERVEEISADTPVGQVVGTNPPAGAKVPPGARISVIVSKGTPSASPSSAEPSPLPS